MNEMSDDEKRPRRWLTPVLLLAILAVLIAALFMEAGGGPTFRAADHDSLPECLAAIPAEWLPGSLERSGAETACHYVHAPRR